MLNHRPEFAVRLANGPADLFAAQRLRYSVFIAEMGGNGPLVDHQAKTESDHFDPFTAHLLLEDLAPEAPCRLVGVYRLMTREMAVKAGGFYSAAEYDISALLRSHNKLLELGRSCVLPDYRGGPAMLQLWAGLAKYVAVEEIDMLFGVASFQGVDPMSLAPSLSYLHHYHSAPPDFAPVARPQNAVAMDIIPKDQIDRKAAIVQTPTLIKAYLRLGGVVGQGAYVDRDFHTTDVCMLVDTKTTRARRVASGKGTKS